MPKQPLQVKHTILECRVQILVVGRQHTVQPNMMETRRPANNKQT